MYTKAYEAIETLLVFANSALQFPEILSRFISTVFTWIESSNQITLPEFF